MERWILQRAQSIVLSLFDEDQFAKNAQLCNNFFQFPGRKWAMAMPLRPAITAVIVNAQKHA